MKNYLIYQKPQYLQIQKKPCLLNLLPSKMITPQKLLFSIQTLNTDRLSQTSSFKDLRKINHEVFINPYPSQPLLKFPKNKTIRKQTQMNTLLQTTNNPSRFSIKPFQKANKSTLYEIPEIRRISKNGTFNPLSKSLDLKEPSIRNFTDIGIMGNKKKTYYEIKLKPDPMLVGESPSKILKCNSSIWIHSRRLRDNGQVTKQQLKWKVDTAIKRAFYGQKEKVSDGNSNISKKFQLNSKKPDFTKVLNYQRRK